MPYSDIQTCMSRRKSIHHLECADMGSKQQITKYSYRIQRLQIFSADITTSFLNEVLDLYLVKYINSKHRYTDPFMYVYM